MEAIQHEQEMFRKIAQAVAEFHSKTGFVPSLKTEIKRRDHLENLLSTVTFKSENYHLLIDPFIDQKHESD